MSRAIKYRAYAVPFAAVQTHGKHKGRALLVVGDYDFGVTLRCKVDDKLNPFVKLNQKHISRVGVEPWPLNLQTA